MSNKKKKNQNKNVNYKKIGIIAGVIALIIGLIIAIGVLTKDEYYECTQYDWYEKVNSDNVLTAEQMKEAYDFYRIFLNKDGTFELKYRIKDGTVTKTDTGTYEKTKTTLVLTYTSPTQELDKVCTYEIKGKTLVRDELVFAPDGTRVTVKQTFNLE